MPTELECCERERAAYVKGWLIRAVVGSCEANGEEAIAGLNSEREYPLPPATVWRCRECGRRWYDECIGWHLRADTVCGPVEEVEA